MTDKESSQADFDAARHQRARQNALALMVDLQLGCIAKMKIDDAKAYLNHMTRVMGEMRMLDIPIAWVTVGTDHNDLLKPMKGNLGQRDAKTLEHFHFFKTGPEPGAGHVAIYTDFMERSGPQNNDVLFMKDSFGAFSTRADAAGPGQTLKTYIKEERGIPEIVLSGGMATYCIAATAQDCIDAGIKATIVTDTVIGYGDGHIVTWKGGEHQDAITDALVREMGVRSEKVGYMRWQPPRSGGQAVNSSPVATPA